MENEELGTLMARYAEARQAFVNADRRADAIFKVAIGMMQGIGGTFKKLPYPRNPHPTAEWIDAVPSQPAIRAVAADWSAARQAMTKAYFAVPPAERGILTVPAGFSFGGD